jgi:hypothetical protein
VELVFFVDQFGMPRIFDGQTTVQIGYPIQDSRDTTITSLSDMDSSNLPYCWAVNYPERNQIWLFMAENSSLMDTCWVLDYSVGFAWTRHSFADDFSAGAIFEKSNGKWKVFTGNYDGVVYEQDTTVLDHETAISSYVVHGDAFNESPTIKSNWTWIELKGATGSNTQYIQLDFYKNGEDLPSITLTGITLASVQSLWGTLIWGEGEWARSGLQSVQKEIGMDAKTIRVKVSNTTASNTLVLEGFSLNSQPQGVSQL